VKKALVTGAVCALVLSFNAFGKTAGTAMKMPATPKAITLNASELKWGAAPPAFPKGANLAVLYGDPFKKGTYTVRLKMPNGYRIAPHWHTLDEQLTVLNGTLVLHMGDKMDSPAEDLEPGAYHFLPGKMHHAAEAKGEVVVQVSGPGPFDIHYLNPADDPTRAHASR